MNFQIGDPVIWEQDGFIFSGLVHLIQCDGKAMVVYNSERTYPHLMFVDCKKLVKMSHHQFGIGEQVTYEGKKCIIRSVSVGSKGYYIYYLEAENGKHYAVIEKEIN